MLSHTVSMKCVREFCQVTGTDEETARSFLSACNDDLDLAVSLYMDDPSRVPSHSATEEYRAPIPQRNEQLLPVVVPLLPTHLQNPAPLQTRRRAFVAEDSDDSSGDDVILTSGEERSVKPRYKPNSSSSSNTEGVNSGSSIARSCHGHVNGVKNDTTTQQKKKRHLQELYQPPVELLFNGSLNAAAITAQEKHQWLLVSVHDEGCFECHLLNRDVWKDSKVYQLIKHHCTFLQIPVDSPEGLRFRSSYSYVQSASHIAVLNPFTREQKMMWTHLNDPRIVYDVLSEFMKHSVLINPNNNVNNGHENINTSSTSIIDDNPSFPQSLPRPATTTDDTTIHYLDAKRPRLHHRMSTNYNRYSTVGSSSSEGGGHSSSQITSISNTLDLTEDEQLQLAIEASKKEANNKQLNSSQKSFTIDGDSEIVITDNEEEEEEVDVDNCQISSSEASQPDTDRSGVHDSDLAEDCILVNSNSGTNSSSFVSSTTATITARRPLRPEKSLHESIFNCSLTSDNVLRELPSPAAEAGEQVFELLIRLPDGAREIYRLPSTLKLQDLHSYFEYRGYPTSRYEVVRIHPYLCLSVMPQSISLAVAGLSTKDTLFIQER